MEDQTSFFGLIFYSKEHEKEIDDLNKIQGIFERQLYSKEKGNSYQINAMRVNIDKPENEEVVEAFGVKPGDVPHIIMFDDATFVLEENVDHHTYYLIKGILDIPDDNEEENGSQMKDVPLEDEVKNTPFENFGFGDHSKEQHKRDEPDNDFGFGFDFEPEKISQSTPLFTEAVLRHDTSSECEMQAEEAKRYAEHANQVLEEAREEFRKQLTQISSDKTDRQYDMEIEHARKEVAEAKKELELYVKVTEALRLVEQVFEQAGHAVEELRSAQKHLDFRMDEWMQQYEYYNETQQRRIDKAQYEGYNEGFQEAEQMLEAEYERKLNEEVEKLSVKFSNKTLIEKGEPKDAVIVNETIISNGLQYLPKHFRVLDNGTIIEPAIRYPDGTFYNPNATGHHRVRSANQTIWDAVKREQAYGKEEKYSNHKNVRGQYANSRAESMHPIPRKIGNETHGIHHGSIPISANGTLVASHGLHARVRMVNGTASVPYRSHTQPGLINGNSQMLHESHVKPRPVNGTLGVSHESHIRPGPVNRVPGAVHAPQIRLRPVNRTVGMSHASGVSPHLANDTSNGIQRPHIISKPQIHET